MEQPGALPQAMAALPSEAAKEAPAKTEAEPTPPLSQEMVSTPPEAARPSEPEPDSPPAQPAVTSVQLAKLSWPADHPITNSRHLATEAIFQLWGASFKAGSSQTACQQAEAQGLACLSGRGGLDDLRRFNRPALLKLRSDQGAEFYATLTSLEGQHARFSLGGAERTVPIEEIALRWSGDYTLLWRTPPHYQGVIQVGDRGPVVEWLRKRLLKVVEKPAERFKGQVFNGQMANAVKKFQLANGLQPDGMVGPQTLILLDMALKPDPPFLTR
jgi:general secretion pathway protein A